MQRILNGSVSSPPKVHLSILGSFQLTRGDQPLRLSTRKIESLFAYLVLHPEAHAREKLAALFWGDSRDQQARLSLRYALAMVRKTLGGEALVSDHESVQLNPSLPIWVDAREFTLPAGAAQVSLSTPDAIQKLNSQIELYRGDLLTDFYDDWILPDRDRYQQLYLDVLLQLAQHYRSASEYTRANETARRVLQLEPANERAHQHLMFGFLALGNRPAALAQYEQCRSALQDEFGVEPTSETTALYEWLKQVRTEATSHAARITNLPIPLTSFVGRHREMAEIKRVLTDGITSASNTIAPRLCTLTGAGGSGKTRLAIQAATDMIDSFRDGVWWAELAVLTDSALVPQAVAKALGVQESAQQPLTEMLEHFLYEKELLLVLDNCEHLLEGCSRLSETLLSHCAQLKILATSREALRVGGEYVYFVPTLSIPQVENISLPQLLLEYESIRLFVERARAIQNSFVLDDENAVAVARICQRLDGIPLAIELAAARANTLSVSEIDARLDNRFQLLTQGSRTALPRQQTLRAMVDWSYDLLSAPERILFRRLAVFQGGFTLEAASAVCAGGEIEQGQVYDLIGHLVSKSLVTRATPDRESRYEMLETIREYAWDKMLEEHEKGQVQDRHLEYFTHWAERAEQHLRRAEQARWFRRIEREINNYRTAFTRALENGEIEWGLRLTRATYLFWLTRGYYSEGMKWARDLLTREAFRTPSRVQVHVMLDAITFALLGSDLDEAKGWLERAHPLVNEIGNAKLQWYYLTKLAAVEGRKGDYKIVLAVRKECLILARTMEDADLVAETLLLVSHAYMWLGDLAAARATAEEGLEIARSLGERTTIANLTNLLGINEFHAGNFDRAHLLLTEFLMLARELQNPWGVGAGLNDLGEVNLVQGNLGIAGEQFRESLKILRDVGLWRDIPGCLESLARLAIAQSQPGRAAKLFGAAQMLRDSSAYIRAASDDAVFQQNRELLRQALDAATFETTWAEGQKLTMERAIRYALEEE